MQCGQCGFDNPPGFLFCGKCGSPLASDQARLTPSDLDHLRRYLPASLVESLRFDLISPSPRLLEQCLAHLSRLIDTTASHLPAYLAKQVIHDPTPGRTGGQFIHGTLLFADISGFTAMSERLSRIGREGAEEITAIVNRYFGVMLTILQEFDGQLVKFGGDALLGLFLDPDGATRAAQAALKMQAAMADLAQIQTSQGVFPLRMKVGLRRGRFFAAQLGASEDMEYALFGADVNATAAAESAAQAGQVLLDGETLAAISAPHQAAPAPDREGYFTVEQITSPPDMAAALSQPFPAFSPSSSFMLEPNIANMRRAVKLLDALTPYLPAGLLPRLANVTQTLGLEGEHRLVAVLFANVHGLGDLADRLGPGREDEIVTALNRYFVAMSDAIRHFGGAINKIDLYDHGDKLLAFFGAPVTHEDDAERAVRAALAMQAALAEDHGVLTGLRQQIGITFGYVFAGYLGTDWRHEYTVMGDEVNLSARLMSVAKAGSVTVSQAIQRKVQALFDLTARGEVKLKGKSMPVPVFVINGLRAVPEPLRGLKGMYSPLVGRQAEWNKMLAALDQALTGRGQIVCITGEAGLGKSRLVAELQQYLARPLKTEGCADATTTDPSAALPERLANVLWIQVRCPSYSESAPYFPFREIVRQLLAVCPDDSEDEAWNKLRQALSRRLGADDRSATLPYLAHLLNLHLGDLEEKIRYLDAQALQRRIFLAIRALIEAYAPPNSAPLLLVLDDVHWMDQASRALLEYLLPLVDRLPLMLILLYRPERTDASWQIHEKIVREFAHCATHITLEKLAPRDSQTLLLNLVGTADWPAGAQDIILNRAEGNPLYVEEVIRVLMDSGVLVKSSGEQHMWRVSANLQALQVPDTLQEVMMARLDRLDEPSHRTAQVASVVGRTVLFDVLAHLMQGESRQLPACLVRLQQHEIILEQQRLPDLVYSFRHNMLHQVCYDSLSARIRRTHHCRIAEYLETERSAGRREAESHYPLIAYHAFAGQDWLRALRYQILAGQQSQHAFANQEAIDHFTQALQSADYLPHEATLPQRLVIHAALGELMTTTGQYDQAHEHLLAALELALERGDHDAEAHACRWLARSHELRGEYSLAFEWIDRGLAALQGRETAEAAHLHINAGLIHSRQGHLNQALEQCQTSLRIAEALGELAVLARAFLLLAVISLSRGDSKSSVEQAQRALDLYTRAGDLAGQAFAHNQIANACFNTGQWSAADRAYRQAHSTFEQIGDVYNRAIADNNLGELALVQGRLDEALTFYQAALRGMEQIGGSLYILGILHNNLGATFIQRGDLDTARAELGTSQMLFEKAQSRDFLPELHRHLAEIALAVGDLTEAEAQGQQSLALGRELQMQNEAGITLRVLGEIALAQSQMDRAESCLRESLAVLDQLGEEYQSARARLALARVYAASGKTDAARSELDGCEPVFTRLDAALDLAAAREMMIRE